MLDRITIMLVCDVEYAIDYYSEGVEQATLALPDTLAARYVVLTRRMVAVGPNLGEPHTPARNGNCNESNERGEIWPHTMKSSKI